jgi:hypothetical protein
MHRNIGQHEGFSPGLNAFAAYIADVKLGKVAYDGLRLQELVATFDSLLIEHLSDEITTITTLQKYKIDWQQYNTILTEHAVKTADKVSLR